MPCRSPRDAVAAALLRLVQALVGPLVEVLWGVVGAVEHRDAEAHGARDRRLLHGEGRALDDAADLVGGRPRAVEGDLRQQDAELFAADAGEDVLAAEARANGRRD